MRPASLSQAESHEENNRPEAFSANGRAGQMNGYAGMRNGDLR